MRGPLFCLLMVLPALALSTAARARPAPPADALALEQAVQEAIARAEPSVACIIVSRSEGYAHYGAAPSQDNPGKLGSFREEEVNRLLNRLPEDKLEERRAILRLALYLPDTVPESFGSGVVLDEAERLVLTNAHVVRNATKVYVRLPNGQGSYADIHAADPRSDLAVLHLIDPVPDLKAIALGDGSQARKGQFVVLVANPFAAGFRDGSPSASWGIIANVRRRAGGPTDESERNRAPLAAYATLLQTDARIEVGCSGGALLNLRGELIGLTTALAAVTGGDVPGGFAVPLDANYRRIIDVLKKGGEVEYGFLGVSLQDPQTGRGVVVRQVARGSPAAAAGFRDGDQIVGIGDRPVRDLDDLFLLVAIQLAGNTVDIKVQRGAERRTLTPTLAKAWVPGPVIASQRPRARLGLRVDFASVYAGKMRTLDIPKGVTIREVVPGSPADKARLQPDKLIVRVNGHRVETPADFYREMDKAGTSATLTLLTAEGTEDPVPVEVK